MSTLFLSFEEGVFHRASKFVSFVTMWIQCDHIFLILIPPHPHRHGRTQKVRCREFAKFNVQSSPYRGMACYLDISVSLVLSHNG